MRTSLLTDIRVQLPKPPPRAPMPSAPPKSIVSLQELAICEDFLDSHWKYTINLWSNIEKIHQWHGSDGCPETREGRTCIICELCSADGLLGAVQKALVSYNDAENHLQEVRASLGECVPSHGTPSRETLFRSNLAKAVFLSIVTVGDTLRSQHAVWQARIQSELATLPSSVQSPKYINTDAGDLDQNRNGHMLFPTYSNLSFVGAEASFKLPAVPTGWVPETTSSSNNSLFVVFKRCLSSDCPCEANRASTASNTSLGGACGSQVALNVPPPSPSNSKKTRTSRVAAKLETAIQGSDNHATRSTTAILERRSRGTSDMSDALAKTRTNAQTQKPSTYHDLNSPDARALDAQRPQDVMPVGEHAPLGSRSETAPLTQGSESSSSSLELIVDPRVFRLRGQIARTDDARRALMRWCGAWVADLQLDTRERHGTGPGASRAHKSTMKDTRGYPSALAHGPETFEPGKSPCKTSQVGEAAKNGLSHDDDKRTAEDGRFNSEQEELKRRWLMARKKRYKDRKRCSALV